MKTFNVIIYNFNARKFEPYDVIPYLKHMYIQAVEWNKDNPEISVPKTFEEFKDFVKKESQYQWWSRCEYELILADWPCSNYSEKWDIHAQVMMNLDIIARTLMESVAELLEKAK